MTTASSFERKIMEDFGKRNFADDHGSQTDDDRAASHANVYKALILRQQRAGEGHQTVGEHQPHAPYRALVLMPCARAMLAFAPVARSEQPRSVPKNQYSSAITATASAARMINGLESDIARAFRAETISG